MALNAAPEIRAATGVRQHAEAPERRAEAKPLEDFLRTRYRDSDDELDKRRLYSVQLYLQHVLWSVSHEGAAPTPPHQDNLTRLVNTALRHFEHVCFVTLNYDLLLDGCLRALAPLESIDDFVRDRYSLIKLHGSVTWGRAVEGVGGVSPDPSADLGARLGTEIRNWWAGGLEDTRANAGFPALSVPLGAEDEVVCPPAHVRFLEERLSRAESLDLLVIGYSAHDRAVLQKLAASERPLRSLTVVNPGEDAALEIQDRLLEAVGGAPAQPYVSVRPMAFRDWVASELESWAERHPAP